MDAFDSSELKLSFLPSPQHREERTEDRNQSDEQRISNVEVQRLFVVGLADVHEQYELQRRLDERTHDQDPESGDKAEDEDPDNVKEVPVQREYERFVRRLIRKALTADLNQNAGAPENTHRHVKTVGTEQDEQAGQERARLQRSAFVNVVDELGDLNAQEAETHEQRDDEKDHHRFLQTEAHGVNAKAAGETTGQEQESLPNDAVQFEQLFPRRAAPRPVPQREIDGEQRGEEGDLCPEEEPEPEDLVAVLFRSILKWQ
ncbi:hypothetical protein BGX30_011807 [Mortierella sp. GBA39]|nr:hypothetical protein BGX30_011807 [Mortierella sp. GBA39]